MAKTCGHAGVMEFNGDVYACDHFVFPEYKLGNINQNTLVEMMYGERQQAFGLMKQQSLPTPVSYTHLIRASAACYASSELAVRLARIAGARLHILHVSTAKELQLFNAYSLSAKHITAEACVAHLLFTLSDYCL